MKELKYIFYSNLSFDARINIPTFFSNNCTLAFFVIFTAYNFIIEHLFQMLQKKFFFVTSRKGFREITFTKKSATTTPGMVESSNSRKIDQLL
jgi:hypothetical protein